MPYNVQLSARAERQLDRIPEPHAYRIAIAIRNFRSNPRPRGVKKIGGRAGAWRLRVGEYRVLYSIFVPDRLVVVDSVVRRTTTTY